MQEGKYVRGTPLLGWKCLVGNDFAPHHKQYWRCIRPALEFTDPDTSFLDSRPEWGALGRGYLTELISMATFHATKTTKGRLTFGENQILVQKCE